jgi:hypothetical protein
MSSSTALPVEEETDAGLIESKKFPAYRVKALVTFLSQGVSLSTHKLCCHNTVY